MIEIHQSSQIITAVAYSALVVSYVWARFFFFTITSYKSRIASLIYDPAVIVQFGVTFYFLFINGNTASYSYYLATFGYCFSLALFWWAIKSSHQLNFAYGENVGVIITDGPFSIVRHPLYISYMITWTTSTILIDSIVLSITLLILASFYFITATKEEEAILTTDLATEYANYKKKVGMFIPRATQWKKWYFKLFHQQMR